ncbi:site-2 protease family protein [Candidatus Kaiserbacteria bacterium]|nr:site-2 protease family protein [Candidatus Kaiserbacteria bacterium]
MAELIIIVALILSIVLHEVAHGYAADWLGDPTARLQGRLTINPLNHIDPLGSVIIPGLLFLSNAGFLFGWAKPVPYNPYNLRPLFGQGRYAEAFVAAAGALANFLLAIIFALLIRSADILGLTPAVVELSSYIVYINILLGFFNLIPLPPLDGSKVLLALLPTRAAMKYQEMTARIERLGLLFTFLLLFLFINVLWTPFSVLLFKVFGLLTGLGGL